MDKKTKQTPAEKFSKLREKFQLLEKLQQKHLDIGVKMLSVAERHYYSTDLLMIGILNRSLDLLDGVTSLVERWNFTCAASLVRLQLDSLLRLVYLSTLEDANSVSTEIIEGRSFREMKDEAGKTLTDAMLRTYARPIYPWVDEIYKETSNLIHFSNKHFFISVNSLDERSRTMQFSIAQGNTNWPEQEIDSLLNVMGCITDALLKCVVGWVISKEKLYESSG